MQKYEKWPESDMDSSNLYLCQKRVREEEEEKGEEEEEKEEEEEEEEANR